MIKKKNQKEEEEEDAQDEEDEEEEEDADEDYEDNRGRKRRRQNSNEDDEAEEDDEEEEEEAASSSQKAKPKRSRARRTLAEQAAPLTGGISAEEKKKSKRASDSVVGDDIKKQMVRLFMRSCLFEDANKLPLRREKISPFLTKLYSKKSIIPEIYDEANSKFKEWFGFELVPVTSKKEEVAAKKKSLFQMGKKRKNAKKDNPEDGEPAASSSSSPQQSQRPAPGVALMPLSQSQQPQQSQQQSAPQQSQQPQNPKKKDIKEKNFILVLSSNPTPNIRITPETMQKRVSEIFEVTDPDLENRAILKGGISKFEAAPDFEAAKTGLLLAILGIIETSEDKEIKGSKLFEHLENLGFEKDLDEKENEVHVDKEQFGNIPVEKILEDYVKELYLETKIDIAGSAGMGAPTAGVAAAAAAAGGIVKLIYMMGPRARLEVSKDIMERITGNYALSQPQQ